MMKPRLVSQYNLTGQERIIFPDGSRGLKLNLKYEKAVKDEYEIIKEAAG